MPSESSAHLPDPGNIGVMFPGRDCSFHSLVVPNSLDEDGDITASPWRKQAMTIVVTGLLPGAAAGVPVIFGVVIAS